MRVSRSGQEIFPLVSAWAPLGARLRQILLGPGAQEMEGSRRARAAEPEKDDKLIVQGRRHGLC